MDGRRGIIAVAVVARPLWWRLLAAKGKRRRARQFGAAPRPLAITDKVVGRFVKGKRGFRECKNVALRPQDVWRRLFWPSAFTAVARRACAVGTVPQFV